MKDRKFQVVYYGETNEYRSHYDIGNMIIGKNIKMYEIRWSKIINSISIFNTPEEGGSSISRMKTEVKAEKGKLLVFENVYKNTVNKHHLSRYAEYPVIKGEKYIFNLWFKRSKNNVVQRF